MIGRRVHEKAKLDSSVRQCECGVVGLSSQSGQLPALIRTIRSAIPRLLDNER